VFRSHTVAPLLAAGLLAFPLPAQSPPDKDYLVLVASEATDQIALVRFGPKGTRVERTHVVGMMPTDPDGPHGLGVSPDGRFYYVSTAHGTPSGHLWKYTTAGDSVAGRVELGNFPATLQVSPDGSLAYVVNFNLHGDMVPSSVSVVSTDEMVEIARLTTCTMPHGSRLNAQGTKHYSACMMDDALVEIDGRALEVSRHFILSKGRERGAAGAPAPHAPSVAAAHAAPASDVGSHPGAGHGQGDHEAAAPRPAATCSPTWAQPSADGRRVYVACNKGNEVLEVDAERWAVARRLPAGDGVYNLAVTRDGRLLVATNKRGQSVSVFDLAAGKELARIPTTRKVVHGVVIAPDDRYAFVSVEGVGSEPGTVEVIDLRTLKRVAAVDVGQMAGGIDFWKSEPAR
jgi:DNA-binding beta-propeller fold protein YncE